MDGYGWTQERTVIGCMPHTSRRSEGAPPPEYKYTSDGKEDDVFFCDILGGCMGGWAEYSSVEGGGIKDSILEMVSPKEIEIIAVG